MTIEEFLLRIAGLSFPADSSCVNENRTWLAVRPRIWWVMVVWVGMVGWGCQRSPEKTSGPAEIVSPPASTPQPAPADASGFLKKVHHAAQEMALDGFQYDKRDLGWPFDVHAGSGASYIGLLVAHHYLDAADGVSAGGIVVANLSDSDPGEAAFIKSEMPGGGGWVVRKDGQVVKWLSGESLPEAVKMPAHQAMWLP